MQRLGEAAQELKDWFMEAVDRDTEAYQAVLAAGRLPKATEEETSIRQRAMVSANEGAARVPLEVLEASVRALDLALEAAREGNPNSISDAGVAGACGLAAAEGAALNVRINLPALADMTLTEELLTQQHRLLARAREVAAMVREAVEGVLHDQAS